MTMNQAVTIIEETADRVRYSNGVTRRLVTCIYCEEVWEVRTFESGYVCEQCKDSTEPDEPAGGRTPDDR